VLTDLVQIERYGEKNRTENGKFRAWLRRRNFPEQRLKAIAQDVEDQIDCTACANCCRVATTQVNERDIERLAKFLGMPSRQLAAEYTVETKDEGRILKRTDQGCVFLQDNLCLVYKARPSTCEYFPHLVKGNGSFISRMWQMVDRATYCPIVFNSLELFKDETGYKK
jgi:uncharacterized protein